MSTTLEPPTSLEPPTTLDPPDVSARKAHTPDRSGDVFETLHLHLIRPSALNPRSLFEEEALGRLTESIRERGVEQPLTVRLVVAPESAGGTAYELIDGERRYRAAQIAGLTHVPVIVREDPGDKEVLVSMLVSSLQREDLNPVEEARAFEALIARHGLTGAEVARQTGRAPSSVSNVRRLLDLPGDVLDLVAEGRLSASHGIALASVADDADEARRFAQAALGGEWPSKRLEAEISSAKRARHQEASPALLDVPASPAPRFAAPGPQAVEPLTPGGDGAALSPAEAEVSPDGPTLSVEMTRAGTTVVDEEWGQGYGDTAAGGDDPATGAGVDAGEGSAAALADDAPGHEDAVDPAAEAPDGRAAAAVALKAPDAAGAVGDAPQVAAAVPAVHEADGAVAPAAGTAPQPSPGAKAPPAPAVKPPAPSPEPSMPAAPPGCQWVVVNTEVYQAMRQAGMVPLARGLAAFAELQRWQVPEEARDSLTRIGEMSAALEPVLTDAEDVTLRDLFPEIKAQASATPAQLAPIAARALALWEACRAAGLAFYQLNHFPFLSWEMTNWERATDETKRDPIDTLYRAPTAVTIWDPDNDMMTQVSDDHSEVCRSTMTYSDLTWLHAFQIGHAGIDPPASRAGLLARERAVSRAARKAPESVTWFDPGYVHKPLPDGSLAHAVTALRMVLAIVRELDALLWLLHTPETLAGQFEAEQCAADEGSAAGRGGAAL